MALPKLDTPLYDLTLTSNEKIVKYRPFLVKEEKILLMALESNQDVEMYNAMKQILNNCIINKKDIDIDKLPIFDVQYLFLQLRAKSVGEIAEVTLKHPNGKNKKGENCNGVQQLEINLSEIKPKIGETHSKNISINDNIGVSMKYPTLDFFEKIEEKQDEEEPVVDALFNAIADSIEYIYQGDDIFYAEEHSKEEILDFINNLNNEQFEKLKNFFSTMPTLEHKANYICSACGSEEELVLNGVEDFFA